MNLNISTVELITIQYNPFDVTVSKYYYFANRIILIFIVGRVKRVFNEIQFFSYNNHYNITRAMSVDRLELKRSDDGSCKSFLLSRRFERLHFHETTPKYAVPSKAPATIGNSIKFLKSARAHNTHHETQTPLNVWTTENKFDFGKIKLDDRSIVQQTRGSHPFSSRYKNICSSLSIQYSYCD